MSLKMPHSPEGGSDSTSLKKLHLPAVWEWRRWGKGSPCHQMERMEARWASHTGPKHSRPASLLQSAAFSLSVRKKTVLALKHYYINNIFFSLTPLNKHLHTLHFFQAITSANSLAAMSTSSLSDHTFERGPMTLKMKMMVDLPYGEKWK